MYDVTLKEAVTITGKSKRTIQRYMGQGKLTFVTDDDGLKLLDRSELIESVGIVTPSPDDIAPLIVTPESNGHSMALLTESVDIAKQQLAATLKNNELLERLIGLQVKATEVTHNEPEPVKNYRSSDKPAFMNIEPMGNYLDDIPTFGNK